MRRVFIAASLALVASVPVLGISRPSGFSRVAGAVLAERAGRVMAENIAIDSPVGVVDGVGYQASAEAGSTGLSIVFPHKADGTYAVLRGQASVAFSVRGAASSAVEVSKGKVAYREIFPGVDAVHQLNGNRSEEFLVLKDERATTEFTYDLDVASGVEFSRLPSGGMLFAAEGDDGDTLAIEAPYVVDATGRTSYEAARYEIDREVPGQTTVRLTVDTTGLAFPLAVDPTWVATTSMSTARTQHAATLLTNGRVMVVGGTSTTGQLLTACEIYNPTNATWAATGSLAVGRTFHTATLLNGGNVLACGGYGSAQSVASAEVWNVTTKTWSLTGQMSQGRERHTATLLPDGRVLVIGGYTLSSVPTTTCEIFNPASGTWSNTGSLSLARANHTAVLLNDGRVMVAGGETTNAQGTVVTTGTVEIYNPAAGTWAAANPCASRSRHAAALLADGRVLIAGGLTGGSPTVPVAIATAQIYNPQTGAWSNAPSMAVAAASLTFTVLGNGRVLATGGYSATTSDNSQVYNPATNTWLAPDTGGLVSARTNHTATRLPSGTVLVCGGAALGGLFAMATAELR